MGLRDSIRTEEGIWRRGLGGKETINKNEEHDYCSIINVVSHCIQYFAKHSRKGVLVITHWAHHVHGVRDFFNPSKFPDFIFDARNLEINRT